MKNIIFIVLAAIIIAGGAGFYGGMKYGQSQVSQSGRFQQLGASGASFNGRGNRMGGGGFASGEIIAKDDKSITVKLRDGGSKIIFYSDSTEIGKFVNGSSSDLEIGKTVSVNGNANQDGSITAQSIQLRPITPRVSQ